MKHAIPFALVCACSLFVLLRGDETGDDPDVAVLPKQVRVTVQFVELPHSAVTELLAAPDRRGRILHQQVMERVRGGDAEIIETATVMAKSGQRATVESVREFIYPSDYTPLALPPTPSAAHGEHQVTPPWLPLPRFRTPVPPCWDTRNVGTTLEILPYISDCAGMIDLRLRPEIVTLADMTTWVKFRDVWGDASVRMPVFQTFRVNTSQFLIPGWFDLAAVLTPKPAAPGPVPDRRIMVFVRADLIILRP